MIVLVMILFAAAFLAVDFAAYWARERSRERVAREVRTRWEARQHLDAPCAVCGAGVGQWCDDGVHHG